jgi:hypothetical protein
LLFQQAGPNDFETQHDGFLKRAAEYVKFTALQLGPAEIIDTARKERS